VTQLSICPIGASDEGRTCGSGAEAHSKRRPRRQLSNEVCWGQNRKNSNRASAVHPITDIRSATLPAANLAASRIFFKQLANTHDGTPQKSPNIVPRILSSEQNYECGGV
jgi:hypothetical protein